MKVLLDECLPAALRLLIEAHEVHTAKWAGFVGLTNGDLLQAAESSGYEALLTVDHGIVHQQVLKGRRIAVVMIQSPTNRLDTLTPLVGEIVAALARITAGAVIEVRSG